MFQRTYGIEIEAYNVDRHTVANALQAAGIDAEVQHYNHATSGAWKVITDSSIQGDKGFEVVSPILQGEEGLRQVKVVMDTLTAIGAKVNKSCGLHVHFGAQDLELKHFKNLFKRWVKFEDCFDALMPESRREDNNIYCRSIRNRFGSDRVQAINNAIFAIEKADSITGLYETVAGCNRYYKLNLGSYARHGTIEFRHHSGTVEAEKAINWILTAGEFLEVAINRPVKKFKVDDASTLAERFKVTFLPSGMKVSDRVKEIYHYYRGRAEHFGTLAA